MRHGSLFTGIGGFDLAAQWMGWENVFQVEWDKWCQKVLAKNFPDALRFGDIVEFNKMLQDGRIVTDTEGAGLLREKELENNSENNGTRRGCNSSDIHQIHREDGKIITDTKCGTAEVVFNRRSQEIRESMEGNILLPGGRVEGSNGLRQLCDGKPRTDLGHIDIITGGFPCQPFSHAGKRAGVADERYLWPEMLRTIRILKPKFVVGENVAGLVSMENGKTLDTILSDLENEGYTTEQVIIPACAVGAWHRRDRIWIIGHRDVSDTKCSQQGQDRCSCGINEEGRTTIQKEDKRRECQTVQHKGLDDLQSDASNPNNKRFQAGRECNQPGRQEWTSGGCCERARQWQSEPPVGRVVDGLPDRMDGYWDREPEGVPRVAVGVKDRVNRLKGLGNAIVPQIALQLFKAIAEYKNI